MPHGLFTRHAKPRFLAIHQDLLDICDGQHCEAALLTEIEFICSVGNISQDQPTARILAGQPLTPYFGISLADLEARILHLYKIDRIRTGMKWLTDRGFLKISRQPTSPGGTTVWGLNIEAVDQALKKGGGADPLEKPTGTPGKIQGSLKEEEVDSLQTKESPPTPLSNQDPPIPTLEDAGLSTAKSLKVNLGRIAKHLKFPLPGASLRRYKSTLDSRYRKAQQEDEAEGFLGSLLEACAEFSLAEMTGDVLQHCEQRTRDRWRTTSPNNNTRPHYDGTQTEQDPKQSCSEFALKLAKILSTAGHTPGDGYRVASKLPDWKMHQIEATAATMAKTFEAQARAEIEKHGGAKLSAGAALETIYRKFGNVQPVKMSAWDQMMAEGDGE